MKLAAITYWLRQLRTLVLDWAPPFYRAPVFSVFILAFAYDVVFSPGPPNPDYVPFGIERNVQELQGGGEVWKVKELADTEALRPPDAYYIDLGYLKRADGSGEWVGYLGEWGDYIELDAAGLKRLMSEGGLAELPDAPESNPRALDWYIWPIVLLFILGVIVRYISFTMWFLHKVIDLEFSVWQWLFRLGLWARRLSSWLLERALWLLGWIGRRTG